MLKQKCPLKNQDLFGHEVKLNFNGEEDSHKTNIGACASIMIKVLMSIYIYLTLLKLLLN